ncbi:RNA-directed DNA polymerase, eukaryota, reverse transcriptase zinc-binding domain protein [Tanacetum coccineum]
MRINKHQVPDGFSSKNFKKAWHVVGDDVCMAIKEFFHNWKLLGEVDATLISLVPKIETPTKVSDFRPIACCNVIYKCISKILTNMIKNSLCKVVSPNQSAFILGRQITDNILISQELLRGYNWNNGAKRVSFKIDIQKAYDTMNWDFLEKTLVLFGKRLKENPEIQILVHWGSKQLKFSQFKLCLMPFNEVNQGDDEESNHEDASDTGNAPKQQQQMIPQTITAAEIQAVEKEMKAKNILLMAIPKEHIRRFHGMDDAKEIWEAIRTRFGGNANSKKMQKAVFKQ